MKVLFVSVSAPPQNTPESLQVAKFLKYLNKVTTLTLVTIRNAQGWRASDPTMELSQLGLREIRLPHYSSRAGRFFARIFKLNWLQKPDEDFMFFRQWRKIISINHDHPQLIYSRSTPFSSAVMALKLKKVYNVPWVMHLSDPWTISPLFSFTRNLKRYHEKLEYECFSNADIISLTSLEQIEAYKKKYPLFSEKFRFFPNVFDDAELIENPIQFEGKIIFLHAGNFYGEGRNPRPLLEAIKKIQTSINNFFDNAEFVFIGRLNEDVRKIFNEYNYPFVRIIEEYTFQESVNLQRNAHVLLLFDWKFKAANSIFFLSKILGYMTSQRPILAITGEDSSSSKVIEGKYGQCFDHDNIDGIENFLKSAIANFETKNSDFFSVAAPDLTYSAERNSNRLFHLFQNLISSHTKANE